jgi:hypothetical protein
MIWFQFQQWRCLQIFRTCLLFLAHPFHSKQVAGSATFLQENKNARLGFRRGSGRAFNQQQQLAIER